MAINSTSIQKTKYLNPMMERGYGGLQWSGVGRRTDQVLNGRRDPKDFVDIWHPKRWERPCRNNFQGPKVDGRAAEDFGKRRGVPQLKGRNTRGAYQNEEFRRPHQQDRV